MKFYKIIIIPKSNNLSNTIFYKRGKRLKNFNIFFKDSNVKTVIGYDKKNNDIYGQDNTGFFYRNYYDLGNIAIKHVYLARDERLRISYPLGKKTYLNFIEERKRVFNASL